MLYSRSNGRSDMVSSTFIALARFPRAQNGDSGGKLPRAGKPSKVARTVTELAPYFYLILIFVEGIVAGK